MTKSKKAAELLLKGSNTDSSIEVEASTTRAIIRIVPNDDKGIVTELSLNSLQTAALIGSLQTSLKIIEGGTK